jgi:hypothetical protein
VHQVAVEGKGGVGVGGVGVVVQGGELVFVTGLWVLMEEAGFSVIAY